MVGIRTDRVRRRSGALVGVVVVVTVAVTLAGAQPAAHAGTHDDAVLDWNTYALEALVNASTATPPGVGQTPPVSQLHLAMMQGAVYDAVNMIDGGHEPYLQGLPAAPGSASKAAAVATAAHDVLVGVVIAPPLTPEIVTRLKSLYDDSIDEATAGDGAAAVAAGIAAGAAAAHEMLGARATDGRYGPFRFTCSEETGKWRPVTSTHCTTPPGPSDLFAWVARTEPFLLESTSQFRTKGPDPLTSRAYAREYNEVKELGVLGAALTPDQAAVAGFYTNNVPPPELFNRTFRTIAQSKGLSLVEQARLFVMLNMAGADSLINCWDDKAFWSFWRPITAIRLGDNDGNPRTAGDAGWNSSGGNPPYPDHPSGYNCVTSAYMHAAAAFLGSKKLEFDVVRKVAGVPDVTRSYDRLTDVIDDTIDARVYQGIHFRAADVQGAGIGKDVARLLDKHFFEPVDHDDDDDDDDEGHDD